MVLFRADKVVVVTLLEATKQTMEQIGVVRMEQADRAVDDSRQLVALYGDLRRLKDYLQRCVGAFRDRVELDLNEADLPLLAASCRRGAELADQRLSATTDGRERGLVQNRRDLLVDWAVELASEPLLELPLPAAMPSLSPAMRALRMRLSQKFARAALADQGGRFTGLESEALPGEAEPVAPSAPPRLPGVRTERASEPARQAAVAEETAPAGDGSRLLQVDSVRDPRLRAVMALDLRALDRAIAASDYRLAAVHLTSVLEGAIIDHALPRTLELGLSGPPDTWNTQEVLLRIFGDECLPRDRAAAYHVFAARSLIHPALQLKSPIVVTALSFRKHMEFVGQALRLMGYPN